MFQKLLFRYFYRFEHMKNKLLMFIVHYPIPTYVTQEPGKIEAEFAKSSELVMKAMLTGRSGKPLKIPKEGFLAFPEAIKTRPLPSWLSEEDINYYASKFEKTGFGGALNYYRNFNL